MTYTQSELVQQIIAQAPDNQVALAMLMGSYLESNQNPMVPMGAGQAAGAFEFTPYTQVGTLQQAQDPTTAVAYILPNYVKSASGNPAHGAGGYSSESTVSYQPITQQLWASDPLLAAEETAVGAEGPGNYSGVIPYLSAGSGGQGSARVNAAYQTALSELQKAGIDTSAFTTTKTASTAPPSSGGGGGGSQAAPPTTAQGSGYPSSWLNRIPLIGGGLNTAVNAIEGGYKDVSSGLGSVGHFFAILGTAEIWIRAGLVVLGVAALAGGIVLFVYVMAGPAIFNVVSAVVGLKGATTAMKAATKAGAGADASLAAAGTGTVAAGRVRPSVSANGNGHVDEDRLQAAFGEGFLRGQREHRSSERARNRGAVSHAADEGEW